MHEVVHVASNRRARQDRLPTRGATALIAAAPGIGRPCSDWAAGSASFHIYILFCPLLPRFCPATSRIPPFPRLSPDACTLACRVIAAGAAFNSCGDSQNKLLAVVILELAAFVYALSSQIPGRKTRAGTRQWLQQGMFSLRQWMNLCV